MPEPTALTAGAVAAAMSAASLALFGVDYYSLLYGLVGSLLALPHVDQMGRGRAMLFVVLSTFGGAAVGNGLTSYLASTSRPVLIVGCLVGGILVQAGAGLLLKNAPRLVEAALRRLQGSSGDKQ